MAASRGYIDSVIEPKETRDILIHALELSFDKTVKHAPQKAMAFHRFNYPQWQHTNVQRTIPENELVEFTVNGTTMFTTLTKKYRERKTWTRPTTKR